MNPYKTLKHFAESDFIEKKSRFIGIGKPLETETEALSFLNEIRAQHRSAAHHCWAYILGSNKGIMRYSDDGEPGGTAGLPIISVMKSFNVTNCMIVVVRYFGGVLLGTGGLLRAYTRGAGDALKKCGFVEMKLSQRLSIAVSYSNWQKLTYYISSAPVITEQIEYLEIVKVNLIVQAKDLELVTANIQKVTDGRTKISNGEQLLYPWDVQ